MGVGGGIIFTPVLYFLFEDAGIAQPVQWSVSSGLLCTFAAASSSTIRQIAHQHLFLKEGILLGIFGSAGITAGKFLLTSAFYEREQFVVFFSTILFYAAFMMFRRGSDSTGEKNPKKVTFTVKSAAVAGGIGGFVASLAGVGGGGVMVPIMNLGFDQPFRKAVSISHLGMVIMLTVGLIQLALVPVSTVGLTTFTFGYVDVGAALPLALAGVVGAYGGAVINHKIDRKYLQWAFAVLSVVMAGRLIYGIL